jgi:vacuolar-type H+-ATPase subunit H
MKDILNELKEAEKNSERTISDAKEKARIMIKEANSELKERMEKAKKDIEKKRENELDEAKASLKKDKDSIKLDSEKMITQLTRKASTKEKEATEEVSKILLG